MSNLVELLGAFDLRRVNVDPKLKMPARTMLAGVSANDLRTTFGLRAKVQRSVANLAAELDPDRQKVGRNFNWREG